MLRQTWSALQMPVLVEHSSISKHFFQLKSKFIISLLTYARSFVSTQFVALGTAALVATWRVLTHADAQVAVLELGALVDVVTRAAVRLQGKSRVARAPERAPRVQAVVLAQSRSHAALVNVCKIALR